MDFDTFLRLACPPLDLQWRKYRRRAALNRVRRRVNELGLKDFEGYLDHLRRHPDEAAQLPDLMRITVSRFFRERDCWLELSGRFLPPLLEDPAQSGTLRAWCAGCCGGEEPYTLAILWHESVAPLFPGLRLAVTATDIDEASLRRAAAAKYDYSSLREVPLEIRRRWFRKTNGTWLVEDKAVQNVVFRRAGILTGDISGGFDIVLCRYLVFTYYRGKRRLQAAQRLASALAPGGILFIGRKEGLGTPERAFFEPLSEKSGIYRKSSVPA